MITSSRAAWLIHKQWSGETSVKAYFFTAELGLVPCTCKGVRNGKKAMVFQAFLPLWLHLQQRYERYFVQSIETSAPMLMLADQTLFAALYVNELIYYALKPLSPEPALFEAYSATLQQLAALRSPMTELAKGSVEERLAIEILLRRFEWSLLKACGHGFLWAHEAYSKQLIRAESQYQFVVGVGFILAKQGIQGQHLLALAQDDFSEVSCLNVAKKIMRQAIDHLLGGREIKARALYSVSI